MMEAAAWMRTSVVTQAKDTLHNLFYISWCPVGWIRKLVTTVFSANDIKHT